MTKGYLLILVILCFIGCGRAIKSLEYFPPQFQDTIELKGRILNDSLLLGSGLSIDFYRDYLVVGAYKGEEEELVHLYRISDGAFLKSILFQGRGPGEVLTIKALDLDRTTGNVWFYDVMLQKLFHFNLDSVVQNKDAKRHIFSEEYPLYVHAAYRGKEGDIAYGGLRLKNGELPRFSIIREDSVVCRYVTYPEIDMLPKPVDMGITYSYLEEVSVSPDRTKLACLSRFGAILEIFDISENEIKLGVIKGFYKPEFVIDKYLQPLPIEDKTMVGCAGLYTSDKYIYSIFCSHPGLGDCRDIAVFDWHGNCVRMYHTDFSLNKICVDEGKNKLYAVGLSSGREMVLIEFDLNNKDS